jgi:hypothetical protein
VPQRRYLPQQIRSPEPDGVNASGWRTLEPDLLCGPVWTRSNRAMLRLMVGEVAVGRPDAPVRPGTKVTSIRANAWPTS